MSQSYFSLGFLSQNSLWKLSAFRGYKRYLYWCVYGMRRISFSQTEWTSDLALRLDWVVSPSRKLIDWPAWDFCPVVQQLAWLFSSPACFTRVPALGTCQSRDLVARSSHQNTMFGKNWLFTFFLTLLYIYRYTHDFERASRENFEKETLEKNKIDSSTIFI